MAPDAAANRLFVGLAPPARIADALGREASALARDTGGRAVAVADLHLTLAFLGPVPGAALEGLTGALAGCLRGPAPRARPGALVGRPGRRRARLAAVELDDVDGALARLAGAVAEAVAPALGRPPDHRPLWPHITLVRMRRPAAIPRVDAVLSEQVFAFSRAALYDSPPSQDGPHRYRELFTVTLSPVP